jgi:uncharacterized membrane protein
MGGVIHLSGKTGSEKISVAIFKHQYPADLILVVVWLAASIVAIYLPFVNTTPLRIILALPVVLFIPGYCLVAALFPKDREIELIERIALSFGLSIAIVPLIGFGLKFTPWGIRLDPIVIALCLFTLVMIVIALYRRSLIPITEQFGMPFSEITGAIKKELFPGGTSRVDLLLSAILCLVILTAIVTTIVAFTVPKGEERYTEFYVLDENRTNTNYPSLINTSQSYPIYIGVGNHEKRNTTYTIETWTILTEFNNITNTSHIVVMDPHDRLSFALTDNETAIIPYTMSVKKPGYDRLEFLLFNESVPGFDVTGSDRINASYRDLHLWVTVLDGQNREDHGDITE